MRGFMFLIIFFISADFIIAREAVPEAEFPAQDDSEKKLRKEEGWICLSADTAMYSFDALCYGGGFAIAYGRGLSVGIKAVYYADTVSFTDVFEFCFLLRLYFKGMEAGSGPFMQVCAGFAIFFRRDDGISFPAQWGAVNAGLNAGWRFLLGDAFYIEPFINAGYPYLAGAGLGVGVRF